VAAIVAVLGLSASSSAGLLAQIAKPGTNLLTVTNGHFQRAGHQPVLRLAGVILAAGAAGLVAGPFDSELEDLQPLGPGGLGAGQCPGGGRQGGPSPTTCRSVTLCPVMAREPHFRAEHAGQAQVS